ncbi:phage tail protein [Streptococcus parauberis]|uniref:phage tail protein n=1 Tax=Streptococcus parauberis TaxID=1348 RepID=UPI0037A2AD39
MSEFFRGGYRVLYFDSHNDKNPKILHEPLTMKSNKLSGGTVNQALNKVDEFTFVISMQNTYYQKLEALNGLVKVINLFDDKVEFFGRILEISGEMSNGGVFHQEIVCEGLLGYLNDMTLVYEKWTNRGASEYLWHLFGLYNNQVEPHKRFKKGNFDFIQGTDAPFIYSQVETAWESVRDRAIGKYGGYLTMRSESDGNYIDYKKSIGVHKKSPIQLGKNIKSASKSISLGEMMTQIVPLGADLETTDSSSGGIDVTRPTVTIVPAHPVAYLEDPALVAKFGIIRKSVVWSEISDPAVLKARGQQYLDGQKAALANWKVSVVDRALIDSNYEKFEIGNYHPIVNAPLSGIEELQIIEKEIDILNPQSVELTIGADSLTLSNFQLQQAAAQKSMEKVISDREAASAITDQISLLKSELNNYQSMSDSYGIEISSLTSQINALDPATDSALINSLAAQRQVATDKKAYYDNLIITTKTKITDLGGTV